MAQAVLPEACVGLLSEVVPGLINFWAHKIGAEAQEADADAAQLINEGYDREGRQAEGGRGDASRNPHP